MPWTKADAKKHCKAANTDSKAEVWAKVANETLEKTKDDGKALAAAATAVGNIKEDEESVHRDRIQEARTSQSGKVEVVVEGDTTTLKNVLLCGRTSRNGRDYPDDVLRTALHMYEDAEVFIGHTKDGSNPNFDRSMGITRNPNLATDGIRGDHSFPTKNRFAEDLVWRAKNAPRGIGYSHDADTTWTYNKQGRKVVKSIDRLYSVDVVTRPATSRGMKEEEEESIPADQRTFAEHAFSAISDCRSIVLDSAATLNEKRSRLLEAVNEFHGELLEGEIGDEMAATEPMHKLRRLRDIASSKLDESMWSHTEYPKPHDKRQRQIAVLQDHLKELKAVQCNCPDCCGKGKTQEQENHQMEWKDITLDSLKANCPELVAKITGTDEHTRLTEEVKTLKTGLEAKDAEIAALKAVEAGRVKEAEIAAELKAANFPVTNTTAYSTRFQEELKAASDKTVRAEIIKDRMALLQGRVQEQQGLPSPLATFADGAKQATSRGNPAHDRFFGVKQ